MRYAAAWEEMMLLFNLTRLYENANMSPFASKLRTPDHKSRASVH